MKGMLPQAPQLFGSGPYYKLIDSLEGRAYALALYVSVPYRPHIFR
jgi:hypothetical protein